MRIRYFDTNKKYFNFINKNKKCIELFKVSFTNKKIKVIYQKL